MFLCYQADNVGLFDEYAHHACRHVGPFLKLHPVDLHPHPHPTIFCCVFFFDRLGMTTSRVHLAVRLPCLWTQLSHNLEQTGLHFLEMK